MILEPCKGVHCVDLGESFFFRRELSNAYFLAKFRFDTAENEPSKVEPKTADWSLGRGSQGGAEPQRWTRRGTAGSAPIATRFREFQKDG